MGKIEMLVEGYKLTDIRSILEILITSLEMIIACWLLLTIMVYLKFAKTVDLMCSTTHKIVNYVRWWIGSSTSGHGDFTYTNFHTVYLNYSQFVFSIIPQWSWRETGCRHHRNFIKEQLQREFPVVQWLRLRRGPSFDPWSGN